VAAPGARLTGGPARADEPVLRIRTAVKAVLTEARDTGLLTSDAVAVGVSGGADSLALAAATGFVGARLGLRVHGLVVDHRLQPGSAAVAEIAAGQLRELGLDEVRVLTVDVTGSGGPEAAARRARYSALRSALPAPDALVLLGHTLDDQAETVLLGLGRGSGPRSIAGMRPLDPPWARPLLGIDRATTVAACARLGLTPWSDPHNADPRFTRVRVRTEVLPLLEDVLAGGVAGALARTAGQLREDNDALEEWAGRVLAEAAGQPAGTLSVEVLAGVPAAVRRRVFRRWILAGGATELTEGHLRLPGGLVARRSRGRLHLD
jgi:tRNA(Ile)-lysidine synthase